MNRRFVRHYVEMLAAMFLGMIVLGVPAEAGLRLLGTSTMELRVESPAVVLIGMAATMTGPMVAWMRVRGHGWRSCAEMALAMFVPAFGAVALLQSAIVEDLGAAMTIEHLAMLPSMLVAMLLRFQEYAGDHRHHHRAVAA